MPIQHAYPWRSHRERCGRPFHELPAGSCRWQQRQSCHKRAGSFERDWLGTRVWARRL